MIIVPIFRIEGIKRYQTMVTHPSVTLLRSVHFSLPHQSHPFLSLLLSSYNSRYFLHTILDTFLIQFSLLSSYNSWYFLHTILDTFLIQFSLLSLKPSSKFFLFLLLFHTWFSKKTTYFTLFWNSCSNKCMNGKEVWVRWWLQVWLGSLSLLSFLPFFISLSLLFLLCF